MNDGNTYSSHALAFSEMDRLTALNQPFRLAFRKANGDMKLIEKALLRKQTPTAKDIQARYKFNYFDVLNDQLGSAYIPLLLSVNDTKIILK